MNSSCYFAASGHAITLAGGWKEETRGKKEKKLRSRDKSAEPRAIEDAALKTGTKCKRTVNTVPAPLGPGQGAL